MLSVPMGCDKSLSKLPRRVALLYEHYTYCDSILCMIYLLPDATRLN